MSLTLTYFDFNGGRGEECRLALHLAGAQFEDDRVEFKDWGARKPNTPWQNMPVLTVEGQVLGQSNAILGWIGREYGLLPSDPWKLALHDSILEACEELRHTVGPTLRMEEEAKQAARAALAADYIPRWGANVERLLGAGPYFDGNSVSVADMKLFVVTRWFTSGGLDHIPADVFAKCPKLLALQSEVAAHPRVAEWYATH